jgi:ribosomal protein S18 acetylase RimI-like enzyme
MRGVVGRQHLSEQERQEVRRLAAVCNAFEGLELKLTFQYPEPVTGDATNSFLYYDGSSLVGFAGMDYGEICGMVRPDMRRQGIGRALFEAVTDECKRRGLTEPLMLCETASRSGQAFVARTPAKYDFAEHHMELLAGTDWGVALGTGKEVELSRGGEDDVEAIAGLLVALHGDTEEQAREGVIDNMRDPSQYFFIARAEGMAISTLRIVEIGEKAGIYGFVVAPQFRGRGYGKAVLVETIHRLVGEGQTRFALEVETDNTAAIALYKLCGFEITTTYEYYKLNL